MDRFEENLKEWLSTCPSEEANLIEPIFKAPSPTHFITVCTSESGIPNLKCEKEGKTTYLYSQADPIVEAEQWFKSLKLTQIEVLFIYGIGLGYYAQTVLPWLKENRNRYLVFFEDDQEVFRYFLGTETCTEMLKNPQIKIVFLSPVINIRIVQYTRICNLFLGHIFFYSSLISYLLHKAPIFHESHATVSFMLAINKMLFSEITSYGVPFFRNFFLNMLNLSDSYFANHLLGKFKGVPAIICGAGPSLNKNIDVLATLSDRALIFAGGTALNALNARGVMPHFGVGIDPNPDQFTRLVMNHAYETPFLYRCRMRHEALEMVHGDRLYISGTGGYEIGKWFTEQLGGEEKTLEEGFNVLNFSVVFAKALGCSPIICVGIDLAYSEGNSYADGVVNHPIHTLKGNFRTKFSGEDLVSKLDIHGNPIFTLWKWIAESMWYTYFTDNFPEAMLINATEGGIGFPHVPNMPLRDVREKYLQKQLNIASLLHGEIQNSPLPQTFSEQKIHELIQTLKDSLLKCSEHCHQILEFLKGEVDPEKLTRQQKEQLQNEVAYSVMLKKFDEEYAKSKVLERSRFEKEEDSESEKTLQIEHYGFLLEAASLNYDVLERTLNEDLETKEKLERLMLDHEAQRCLREKFPVPLPSQEDEYVYQKGLLIIKDKELGINYYEKMESTSSVRQEKSEYPSGKLKAESSYDGELLHGPSYFYHENGTLLASTWFIEGRKEGKAWTYYPDGKVHSLKYFREGLQVGIHRYFYPNGLPKSILPYREGALDGEVSLFASHGGLVRQLTFVQDKREGQERIWDKLGVLRIECVYAKDRPIGISRMWHANGMLAKEVYYDDESKRLEEKEWDAQGNLIEIVKEEDYFDQISKQTEKLTNSLQEMVTNLSVLTPMHAAQKANDAAFIPDTASSENAPSEIADDMLELKKEMERLQSLEEEIRKMGEKEESKEAIWKTPASQKEMERHFNAVREQMNQNMERIQQGLKTILSTFPSQDKNKKNEMDKQ